MNSNQGLVRCSRLAAATAQSESAVLTGLKWLAANGSIQFDAREADSVWLSAGGGQKEGSLQPLGERLKSILEETAAYRQYYMRANQDALLRIS